MLKTLAYLERNQCNALRFKYGLGPYDGTHAIKHAVFDNFSLLLRYYFMFCRLYLYFIRVLRFMFVSFSISRLSLYVLWF